MAKYIQKARHIARETSYQIHNARDDATKRQLQRERSKMSSSSRSQQQHHSSVSNSAYKFSDIGKWMDKDLDDDNDETLSVPDSSVPFPVPPTVNASHDHTQKETTPSKRNLESQRPDTRSNAMATASLFDDGPELDNNDYLFDEEDKDLFVGGKFGDPLGLVAQEPEKRQRTDMSQHETHNIFTETQNTVTKSQNTPESQDTTVTREVVVEAVQDGFTFTENQADSDTEAQDGDVIETTAAENAQSTPIDHSAYQQQNDHTTDKSPLHDDVVDDVDLSLTGDQEVQMKVEKDVISSEEDTLPEESDELFYSLSKSSGHYPQDSSNNTQQDDDELFQSFKVTVTKVSGDDPTCSLPNEAATFPSTSKTLVSNQAMLEAEDHPLLHLQDDEDEYFTNATVQPVPIAATAHHSSSPLSPNSSPENSSPLSSSPHEKASRLTVNRSGKLVPVVPPRPKSAATDTISVISTTSSLDEVFANDSEHQSLLMDSTSSVNSTRASSMRTPPVIKKDASASVKDTVKHTTEKDRITILSLSICVLLLYLYYSLNPFVYLAGFMAGFMLFYITFGSAFVLYVQYSEREKERRKTAEKKVVLPPLDELPKTIQVDFEGNRELKSNQFGLVMQYHPSTHHPSQRLNAKVKLYQDFMLDVRYKVTLQSSQNNTVTREETLTRDLTKCSVLIVPEEVAQNRKRRWSKKFPISISWLGEKKGHIFLFPITSREKEVWFRRLRAASEGTRYDKIVEHCSLFYRYMGNYMPRTTAPSPLLTATPTLVGGAPPRPVKHQAQKKTRHNHHHQRFEAGSVRFSAAELGVEESEDFTIIQEQKKSSSVDQTQSTVESRSSFQEATHTNGYVSTSRGLPNSRRRLPDSLPLSLTMGWINAGMARLAWDLWHEERWKNWVTSRIQRKLIRIKTPPFMEELKVTQVNMGMDMPVLRKPFKQPRLDQEGIWIYLEVEYSGSFTMTIETKLKLGPKGLGEAFRYNSSNESPPSSQSSAPPTEGVYHHKHGRHRVSRLKANYEGEEEEISSGSDEEENSSLTHSLEEKLPSELEAQGITLPVKEPTPATDAGSTETTSGPPGRKEKLLTNMVSGLQKIAAKSRIVARAAEKVSSYPLILTVEVKRLDGLLVLNMAPPPSDAIWYGFHGSPKLDLVAKPKLGHREVTLSYVTDWIEKKLCEVVEKKLVLPNMEDLVVPVLSSGLPEDKLKEILTSP